MNKFSILAPDDNEFTGEWCTFNAHVKVSQCQQRRCGDERVDEWTTAHETKVSSHRGFGHIEAERSSSVVPCGVKWRQQGSSSCEWIWVEKTERDHMDSGSAECVTPESLAKSVPVVGTEALRQEQTYHTADGDVDKKKGEKTVTMHS